MEDQGKPSQSADPSVRRIRLALKVALFVVPILLLLLTLCLIFAPGYRYERWYLSDRSENVNSPLAIEIAGETEIHRLPGLFAINRYGAPYSLYFDYQLPPGNAISQVLLQHLIIHDAKKIIKELDNLEITIATARGINQMGKKLFDNRGCFNLCTFDSNADSLVVEGKLLLKSQHGQTTLQFIRHFRRNVEREVTFGEQFYIFN